MKKNIFYFLILFAFVGFSQTYNIATENGNTINDCSGVFVDSGGTGGNYSSSENYTVTFCPDTPGDQIVLDFNAGTFNIEGSTFDFLTVYNGDDTGDPLYGTFTGNPGVISSSHSSGCLTISFQSDGSFEYAGWEAAISCQTPCTDTIVANLDSTNPVANGSGAIQICQGDTVDFVGSGTFSGSSAGASYDWNFGDGGAVASGTNVSHTFNTVGVFLVNLEITNGLCQSTNKLNQVVQVSPTPDFTGTAANSSSICLGETTDITGVVTPQTVSGTCAPPLVETTFLPDSNTATYSTCITVDCYGPSETISNASDILSVFLNMEHSYMGDLQLTLTAPNGSSAILHTDGFGGATNLGDPDQNDGTGPGTGWDYYFVETGTTGVDWENGPTMVNGTGNNSLQPGSYDSDNSFAAFIGSPLNGDWCLTIEDSLLSDDGHIFSWNVNFDSSIPPVDPNLTFTQTIASSSWAANDGNGNIIATSGSTITVQPTATGTRCYTYTVVDGFGCSYDHQVCIDVNAGATADASVVASPVCSGGDANFTISGTPNAEVTYNINGGTDQTITLDGSGNATIPTISGITTDQTINLISVVTSAAPTVGNGVSATGATDSANAVGTMVAVGTTLDNTNSALVAGGANSSLVITLGDVVPAGTTVTISIARNTGAGAVNITDGTNTQAFNAGPNDVSQQITFTTGVATNTITINRTGGSVWVDGVEYTIATTTCTVPLTDSETVVVSSPTANAGADGTITCTNTSVQIGAASVAGFTYSWSPATGLDDATISNPTSTVGTTTTYTLTITETATGCTATDDVTVTVNNTVPTANAGTDGTITCTNTSVQIGTASVAGFTYSWSPATGLDDATISNPTSTVGTTTTYTLTITDTSNGCTDTDDVTVTVDNDLPTANAGADGTITCVTTSVQIGAASVAGFTYSWSPATGLDDATISNPTSTVGTTTTYTLTITETATGCIDTDDVTVTVIAGLPTANAGADGTITCTNTSVQIGAASVAGFTYSWSPATGLDDATISNPTSTVGATTTYTLTITETATGCTATDDVTVTVNNTVPTANAGTDGTITCTNTSVQIGVASAAGFTYSWSPATGLDDATISNPTSTVGTTTTYTVTITDTSNGCTDTDDVTVTVDNDLPTANAGADGTITCVTTSVQIGAAAAAGFTYSWSPATGLDDATISNPTSTVGTTTTYTLTITETATGCTDTDDVTVTVDSGLPTANAGTDGTITCTTTSVQIGAASVAGFTYSWSPATGLDDATISNPTSTVGATTTYTLTITETATGCTATDDVTVTVNNTVPTANAGTDGTITCTNTSVQIGAASAAGFTYSWSPATGLDDATISNPTSTVGTTTTYTLTITDTSNGCTDTDD
ncbi:beta strand repeat-containing protein, partial [Pseudofulvibacter geojedonensis]